MGLSEGDLPRGRPARVVDGELRAVDAVNWSGAGVGSEATQLRGERRYVGQKPTDAAD